jgi:DNA-binding transcriptional LysR family regulator
MPCTDSRSGSTDCVSGQAFRARRFAEVHDVTLQLAMIATGLGIGVLPGGLSQYAPPDVTFVPLNYQEPLRTSLLHDRRHVPVGVREMVRPAGPAASLLS